MRQTRVLALALLALGCASVLQAQPAAGGRLTITYTLERQRQIASDQFAIWIEDEKGQYVRTLFATDFVSRRGGWKLRPQTTPTWVAAAGIANAPQSAIDAVSGATPARGLHTVVRESSSAGTAYSPPEAAKLGNLISAVTAVYEPGN